MADVRISNLSAAVAANLDGNSLVPTTDSELTITTVKVTLAQMRTGILTRANGNYAATDYLSLGGAAPPSTGWIRVDGTTVTASTPILNAIQTWNQGATVFTGILVQITNTTSSASSLLIDMQVGGFSKWKVDVSGNATTAGNLNTQAITATTGLFTGLGTFNAGVTVASGQTLTLTGATVAGAPTWSSNQAITLSTAAQPNITSVGTLANLTVTATITGSVSGSAATAGTVTAAAQPAITSVGTLTSLTVSGAFASGAAAVTTLAGTGAVSGFTSVSTGSVTYTSNVASVTGLATPSALVATNSNLFASTVSGATLMGFGTTGDVTLKNRAGTDVLVVTSNTLNVTLAGALAMSGALSGATTGAFSGAVTVAVSGMTNSVKLAQVSDATTQGAISFNGAATLAGMVGLSGGAVADTSFYFRNVTGGTFNFLVNNAQVAAITAAGAGIFNAGISCTTGTFSGAVSGITTLAGTGAITGFTSLVLSSTLTGVTSIVASANITATSDIKSNTTGFYAGSGAPALDSFITGLSIQNKTAGIVTTPSGGGKLYASAGALLWIGSSGTVTTIAPA